GSSAGGGIGGDLGKRSRLLINDNSVTWLDGDAALVFPKIDEESYALAPGDVDANELEYHAGTEKYTLTSKRGMVSLFDSNGILLKQTSRDGNSIGYTYEDVNGDGIESELTSITDSLGRTHTFNYTGGVVTSVTD